MISLQIFEWIDDAVVLGNSMDSVPAIESNAEKCGIGTLWTENSSKCEFWQQCIQHIPGMIHMYMNVNAIGAVTAKFWAADTRKNRARTPVARRLLNREVRMRFLLTRIRIRIHCKFKSVFDTAAMRAARGISPPSERSVSDRATRCGSLVFASGGKQARRRRSRF